MTASTQSLVLRSHAGVIHAKCCLALSCWNKQGGSLDYVYIWILCMVEFKHLWMQIQTVFIGSDFKCSWAHAMIFTTEFFMLCSATWRSKDHIQCCFSAFSLVYRDFSRFFISLNVIMYRTVDSESPNCLKLLHYLLM